MYQSFPGFIEKAQRPTDQRLKVYKIYNYINKDSSILDIGCNTGFLLMTVAQKVKSCLGIDFNKDLIDIANKVKKYKHIKNCDFKHVDFNVFKTDKKFDCIFSFAVHGWIPGIKDNPEGYAEKLYSMLNENGYILIESHDLTTMDKDFDNFIDRFCKDRFEKVDSGSLCDDYPKINRKFFILKKI